MRREVLSVAVILNSLIANIANSCWIVMFPPCDVSQVKTPNQEPQMTGGESGADIVSCTELYRWDIEPCVLLRWSGATVNSLSLLYPSHSFLFRNNKQLQLKNETFQTSQTALNVLSDKNTQPQEISLTFYCLNTTQNKLIPFPNKVHIFGLVTTVLHCVMIYTDNIKFLTW